MPTRSEVTVSDVASRSERMRAFQAAAPVSRLTIDAGTKRATAGASMRASSVVSTRPPGCVDIVRRAGAPKSVPVMPGALTPFCVNERCPAMFASVRSRPTLAVAPVKR